MYLKQTILACLVATYGCGALAEQLALKPGHPDGYVVQKGDTLWDISGQFLAKPWLWPRLWNINPQVANPNLIYPGDVLALSWVNGEPHLGKATHGGKPVIHLHPNSHYENKANPIPTLPLSEIGPFLQTDHILADPQQTDTLPYIIGNNETHVGMLEGDTLFVQGQLAAGQIYGIYHPGVLYRDRQTGELLGQEAIFAGTVRAEESLASNITRVTLLHNRREAYQGDKIMPLPAQESLSATFMPKAAPDISSGYIVELPSKAHGGGKFDVVLVNKGLRDRVTPGDVLEIKRPGVEMVSKGGKLSYREYASTYDKVFYSSGKATLPDEALARIMLFKVYDKLSYGLILQSREMVDSGYQVSNL